MLAESLRDAMERRDKVAFDDAAQTLFAAIPELSPEAATETAVGLMPVLAQLPWGIGSELVGVVGALCARGAHPSVVLPALVDRAIEAMAEVEGFKTLAGTLGIEPPRDRDGEAFNATADAVLDAARSAGIDERQAMSSVEAWFVADDWIQPLLYLSQREQVRLGMPRRAELSAALDAAQEDLQAAHWLRGLLLVLDGEPLLVLHRATGQGWRCSMSGIGDNFQLHTLLANRLAGQIPETAPSPIELAAAESGEPVPPGGITGNLNLVDSYGDWIWNEGRPADIPEYEGIRVAVIDPPPYPRTWNAGRLYPLMAPTLTVDAKLTEDDAAAWISKVKPNIRG